MKAGTAHGSKKITPKIRFPFTNGWFATIAVKIPSTIWRVEAARAQIKTRCGSARSPRQRNTKQPLCDWGSSSVTWTQRSSSEYFPSSIQDYQAACGNVNWSPCRGPIFMSATGTSSKAGGCWLSTKKRCICWSRYRKLTRPMCSSIPKPERRISYTSSTIYTRKSWNRPGSRGQHSGICSANVWRWEYDTSGIHQLLAGNLW